MAPGRRVDLPTRCAKVPKKAEMWFQSFERPALWKRLSSTRNARCAHRYSSSSSSSSNNNRKLKNSIQKKKT